MGNRFTCRRPLSHTRRRSAGNLLFQDTAYILIGFAERDTVLFVVLKQTYISSDGTADLDNIKQLLGFNGFENTKNNDYFNKEFGLILEDMHDENVIAKDDMLFFIDTVFFTVSTNDWTAKIPV